jgi:hypothetical protein
MLAWATMIDEVTFTLGIRIPAIVMPSLLELQLIPNVWNEQGPLAVCAVMCSSSIYNPATTPDTPLRRFTHHCWLLDVSSFHDDHHYRVASRLLPLRLSSPPSSSSWIQHSANASSL